MVAARPITVDGVNLTDDALGRMVEQNSGSNYDEIAYTPTGAKLALMSGSTLVKAFIGLPAGAQAVYTSSGLAYYRHGDPLGSSRFASTPSQTMYSDTAYAPFGEHYATVGTTDLSFTGQNQDTVTGVYDFPARELGQISGRWPSPDPAGMAAVNPGDPQTWNRYAYVRNSPLNFTDPTGLILKSDPCGDGGCGGGDGYCPPWFAYCGDPCEIFGEECDDGGDDGGGGGGSPGLPPAAPPSFPLDTTNALNEVDGVPAGYQLPQLSAWCLVSPSCSGPSVVIQNYTDQQIGPTEVAIDLINGLMPTFFVVVTATAEQPQATMSSAPKYAAYTASPNVCSDYLDGTVAGSIAYGFCAHVFNNSLGNGAWGRCVRAKLLDQYTRDGTPFQYAGYLLYDHPEDFLTCGLNPYK